MLQLRAARAARIFVTFIWRNLKNKTVNILRLILSTSWSYHIVTYHSDSFPIFTSNLFARNTYASAKECSEPFFNSVVWYKNERSTTCSSGLKWR